MKAVQFARCGGPEVLQVQDVAEPKPASGEVLIAVKATTVNRLDLFQRNGSRPVSALPFTPGLEAAGIVVEDAEGFSKGDRVLTTRASGARGGGGYASQIAVPAGDLVRIPANVSFEMAAAAGLAGSTAWGALFDLGNLQRGERVLIWAGSSGVGTLAIQFAKQAGAWVATTASSEERGTALRKLGADLVINHKQQDIGKTLQNEGGVNLVVELVGNTLQASIEACTADGRVILIGNLGGKEAAVDTQSWRLKRVHVIGGGMVHTSPENEQKFIQLIAEQKATPLIESTLPIEEAAEAHRQLEAGHPQGKIVLIH